MIEEMNIMPRDLAEEKRTTEGAVKPKESKCKKQGRDGRTGAGERWCWGGGEGEEGWRGG